MKEQKSKHEQQTIYSSEFKEKLKHGKYDYSRELDFAIFSLLVYELNAICWGLLFSLSGGFLWLVVLGILFLFIWIISYFFSLRPNFYGNEGIGDWDAGMDGSAICFILLAVMSLPAYFIVRRSPFQDTKAEERREQRKRRKEEERIRKEEERIRKGGQFVETNDGLVKHKYSSSLNCQFCHKPLSNQEKSDGYHKECYRIHY
ncbi:MAG: hypothetical protein ACXAC8_20015 [Candidatus Hodarchaeales archaeon]|jgi:hypothetical protein